MIDDKPAEKAVEESFALVRDFFARVAGPAADSLAAMFRDQVDYWRFKRGLALVQAAKQLLAEKGVEPRSVPPKILLPILENGALEEDDSLKKKWVALLANAADLSFGDGVHPSYPDTLKQLSAVEVRLLDALYKEAEGKTADERNRLLFSKDKILTAFGLTSGAFDILADNLFRLGLCQGPSSEGGVAIGGAPLALRTRAQIEITSLGYAFIEACRY